MRQIIRLIILAASLMSVMADAVADTYLKRPGFEHQEDPSAITIMFVNGVLANETDTQADSDALNRSLKLSGLPQLKYNFTYVANPTDGWINDPSEVLRQADISNLFFANGTYYKSLGDYYNSQYAIVGTLSGVQQRVVSFAGQLKQNIKYILTKSAGLLIVPHSQGNLYVEAAYAMLQADGYPLLSRIRVVGVAVAAASTPSGRYITHDDDFIIWSGILPPSERLATYSLANFVPKTPNETACFIAFCGASIIWGGLGIGDVTAHLFQEVYLNIQLKSQASGRTFPKIIYDLVSSSLSELEAPKPPITAFDNLGDRQFCDRSATSVSCSGNTIGLIPGFGSAFPPQPDSKLALAFDVPAGAGADLTSIELAIYLGTGTNQIFLNIISDLNGLPDTSSSLVSARLLTGVMTTIPGLFGLPNFPTLVQTYDSGAVYLQGGKRYWVEIKATNPDTRATWTFGRLGGSGLYATSRSGSPYIAAVGAPLQPAARIVITPR